MRFVPPLPFQAVHGLHHIVQIAFVGIQARECAVDERALEVFIRDAEMPRQARGFSVLAQHVDAEPVERARGDGLGNGLAQGARQATLHFRGGFVGKGERRDALGRDPALRDQIRNALGQHARLARARPGEDEHCPDGRGDGLALPFIQCDGIEVWHGMNTS